ncbi:MAG: DinB family protein [Thermomicrobiales bacterium]
MRVSTDASELEALIAWLQHQRDHALGILDGLTETQLRQVALPSGWSCLEMMAHLVALERFWFCAVVAGNPAAAEAPEGDPRDWRVPEGMTAPEVFAAYRRQAAVTDAILRETSLDAAPAWWPVELFGEWRLASVRDVVLHTLTETAGHTGHLDAARELIDGRQWLVLEA